MNLNRPHLNLTQSEVTTQLRVSYLTIFNVIYKFAHLHIFRLLPRKQDTSPSSNNNVAVSENVSVNFLQKKTIFLAKIKSRCRQAGRSSGKESTKKVETTGGGGGRSRNQTHPPAHTITTLDLRGKMRQELIWEKINSNSAIN